MLHDLTRKPFWNIERHPRDGGKPHIIPIMGEETPERAYEQARIYADHFFNCSEGDPRRKHWDESSFVAVPTYTSA